MFYQVTEKGLVEVSLPHVRGDRLTFGYLSVEDLEKGQEWLGFETANVENCRNASDLFRSGVEVHSRYTFTQLRILNSTGEADDYIALFLKQNLVLVVDIQDADGSTRAKYLNALKKYPPERISAEKFLSSFLDQLLSGDFSALETIERSLADQEEALFEKKADRDFTRLLLETKKALSERHAYYAQLLDIAEAVTENDNAIFTQDRLIYVDNVAKKIERLIEETNSLRASVEHLQDAYTSSLDSEMNRTMKIFTVLTSIFFPLTIIVGWYGMNFTYMPELKWKLGYVYVIVLSIVTILVFAIIGKKKKWF